LLTIIGEEQFFGEGGGRGWSVGAFGERQYGGMGFGRVIGGNLRVNFGRRKLGGKTGRNKLRREIFGGRALIWNTGNLRNGNFKRGNYYNPTML
jgi:hypothetical protein